MIVLLSLTALAIIMVLIKALQRGAAGQSECTEWAYYRDCLPRVYYDKNGNKVFEHSELWQRFNKRTQRWELKTVIDPARRPLNKAKSLSDLFFLHNY